MTARDHLAIHFTAAEVDATIDKFVSLPVEEARAEFELGKDAQDWKVALAQNDAKKELAKGAKPTAIDYRPFDKRMTFYSANSKGFLCRPRPEVMRNFIGFDNLGIISTRQRSVATGQWPNLFVASAMIEGTTISNVTREINYLFPLWLKPQGTETRTLPNLAPAFANRVATLTGLGYDDGSDAPAQAALAA